MRLFSPRLPSPEDFESCLGISHDNHLFQDSQLRIGLKGLWALLLGNHAAQGGIVAAETSTGPSVVGFGLSVFVRSHFLDELKSFSTGGLSAHFARTYLRNPSLLRSALLLSSKEIACANAAHSLNLFVLHYGVSTKLSQEEQHKVGIEMFPSLIDTHRGYGIQWFGKEAWSLEERDDLSRFMRCKVRKQFHLPQESWVMERRSDPSVGENVEGIDCLFSYNTAILRLTDRERDVLFCHTRSLSAKQTALALGMRVCTVNGHWRNVLRKLEVIEKDGSDYAKHELRLALPSTHPLDWREGLRTFLMAHPEHLRPSPVLNAVEWQRC